MTLKLSEETQKQIGEWKDLAPRKQDAIFEVLMQSSDAAFDAGRDDEAKAFDVVSALLRSIS
jgi:hypothetical protein